jgi:hypothetical protein
MSARLRLAWIAIPALVLAGAELLVREVVDRVPLWYAAADVLAADRRIDALFVGSSRVGAAVFVPAFEETAGVTALNLGRGDSTTIEHYLGLRNLLERHPESFRGVDVFLEAPAGWAAPVAWEAPWGSAEQPWMLIEVLRASDLPRFWRRSTSGVEEKIHISVRELGGGLSLLRRRERFRQFVLTRLVPWLASALRGEASPLHLKSPALGADLQGWSGAGRTRTEGTAPAEVRRLVEELRSRRFFPPWEGSVVEAMAHLVSAAGGRLVFFEVPLGETFRAAYETVPQQEARARFLAWAGALGLPVLAPEFRYAEADIPDWQHLSARRAPEFAAALARAWTSNR